MTKADTNYIAHLFEQMSDQNKAILEAVSDMQQQVKQIPKILLQLDSLDNNMAAVMAAIKDLSQVEKQQNYRLDSLEARIA